MVKVGPHYFTGNRFFKYLSDFDEIWPNPILAELVWPNPILAEKVLVESNFGRIKITLLKKVGHKNINNYYPE